MSTNYVIETICDSQFCGGNFKITYKTFSLKEDAVRWARETEVKIERGLYQDLTLSKTTKLKDVLAQYRDRVSINKKGYEQEHYKINKIIRSDIADKTLSQLTPLVLFEYIEQQNIHSIHYHS